MALKRKAAPRAESARTVKGRGQRKGGLLRRPGGVDQLKRCYSAKGITKANIGAVDTDGVWRGKYISLEKFYSAAKGGLGFCDVGFGWDLSEELYDHAQVPRRDTGYP